MKDILSLPVRSFIEQTAAKTPTPGGGSVAGVVGALAVALGEMSLNFTRGKKKFAAHKQFYDASAKRLARARGMFLDLVEDDMRAYLFYQQTTRLPDGPEKLEQTQLAVAQAINIPRQMTKLALAVLAELNELADKCNPWLISDLAAAAALAVATVQLSQYNVRINAPNLSEPDQARQIRQAADEDLHRARHLHETIEQTIKEHLP